MNDILSWSAVGALIAFTIQQAVKTLLDIKKSQSEVVFTQLHKERAIVIKTLYEKMAELAYILNIWDKEFAPIVDTTPSVPSIDLQKRCHEIRIMLEETSKYFRLNKIYFSNKLSSKISFALDCMYINERNAEIRYLCKKPKKIMRILSPYYKDRRYIYLFSTLVLDIEKEFRKLLGSK